MVTFGEEERIPIQDFVYAWRLTDEKYDLLPEKLLERVTFLNQSASERIQRPDEPLRDNLAPNERLYEIHEAMSLKGSDSADHDRYRHWLASLPVPCSEQIYVLYQGSEPHAVVLDWFTFVATWDSWWYADDLDVFDDSMGWALIIHHEEEAWFVTRR